ncbi:MAG: hypothetical protein U0793_06410 [Gemmataceae bacterium]
MAFSLALKIVIELTPNAERRPAPGHALVKPPEKPPEKDQASKEPAPEKDPLEENPALEALIKEGQIKAEKKRFFKNPATFPPPLIPPADANAVDLHSPDLKSDRTTVLLPGPIKQVAVGGAGRFLIFLLPRLESLAVFDVNEARIVKYLPAPSGDVLLAAGLEKLVIVEPASARIERWSLKTFKREAIGHIPLRSPPVALAMGRSSHGPLLLRSALPVGESDLCFFDIASFKRFEYPGMGLLARYPVLTASAAGRLFTAVEPGATGHGLIALEDARARVITGVPGHGILIPSADGRDLYTFKTIRNEKRDVKFELAADWARPIHLLPAYQGPFFLALRSGGGIDGKPDPAQLGVYIPGPSKFALQYVKDPDLIAPGEDPFAFEPQRLSIDRRVHLIPQASLLVIIPPGLDRLHLHRLPVPTLLKASTDHYLFAESAPPTFAVRGQDFSYAVRVQSSSGGVKTRLEKGPEGMSLTPDHWLHWRVPKKGLDKTAITLAITDKSGVEVLHRFELTLLDEPPSDRSFVFSEGAAETPPRLVRRPRPFADIPPPDITPPSLDEEVATIPVPAFDSFAGAGRGRFLILAHKEPRRLGLFDVSAARIVHQFPVSDNTFHFTAGSTKLVIAYPRAKVIQRWDLLTREKEMEERLDVDDVRVMRMGSDSQGPVLMHAKQDGKERMQLLDLQTLRAIPLINPERSGPFTRVSADGLTFGGPSRCATLNDLWLDVNPVSGARHVAPSEDGRYLYFGDGLASSAGAARTAFKELHRCFCAPAEHGPYFVSFTTLVGAEPPGMLRLHLEDEATPFARLPDVVAWDRAVFADERRNADQRIRLIPEGKVLLLLPPTDDQIILHKVDAEALLAVAKMAYLFFSSRPPRAGAAGARFQYKPALTSSGPVSLHLEAGPEGMTLGKGGLLSWDVPPDGAGKEFLVILRAATEEREAFHSFRVYVKAAGGS